MHVLNSNKNLTKEQNYKLPRNESTHFPSNFPVQWTTLVDGTYPTGNTLSASTSTLVFFTAQSLHTHSHTKRATCTSLYLLQSSNRSTLPLTLISAHVFEPAYFTKHAGNQYLSFPPDFSLSLLFSFGSFSLSGGGVEDSTRFPE